MSRLAPGRPAPDEYLPYFGQYIRLVPDGDIVAILDGQLAETVAFWTALSPEQAQHRRAPGEWNAIEIIGHMADTERILAYRALRIARADRTPLTGVEFEPYVVAANFARRPLAEVVEEFALVRRATMPFLRSLDSAAWLRRGTADGNTISVRALAYILAGHELHHLADLRGWLAGEAGR